MLYGSGAGLRGQFHSASSALLDQWSKYNRAEDRNIDINNNIDQLACSLARHGHAQNLNKQTNKQTTTKQSKARVASALNVTARQARAIKKGKKADKKKIHARARALTWNVR